MIDVQNYIGMGLSLVYIGLVLAVSGILSRKGASSEATRKFVHIALGGWWVIAALYFDSPLWAAALPAVFIVVNGYAYRKQVLRFMSREEGDTPGTVYYAVSLTALALFSFWIGNPYVGALGVFSMAFGDGFAAVIGKRYGSRKVPFSSGKTLVGSAVMFAVSFFSCAAVLLLADRPFAVLVAALLAAAAAVFEAVSSDGLDNLTVPLGVSALYAVLFLPAAAYTPVLVGLLLSGAVAVLSIRFGLLTVAGGLGAAIVGALAFSIGGWPLWLLLMWFFGSSNIASRIMAKRSNAERRKKHETRRLRQVLANSVPFLACAVVYAITGDSRFLIVSAAALAASTADTWASEIGVFSANPPINILTGKRMQRGLSGGVSPLGLVATAIGSATSAFLAMLLFHAFGYSVPTGPDAFFFIIACGVLGSLVDSVLGSLLQAKYRVSEKPDLVEAPSAGGRGGYVLVSGYAWVTNDAVNFMSGAIIVALGLLLVV